MIQKSLRWSVSSVLIGLLVGGCGGGGGGTSALSVSGTVATGSPVASGTVTIFDAAGTQVGTASIAADGSYTASVPSTVVGPLILRADFDGQELYSTKTSASSGVANISQLTSAVVAMVSPSGDPSTILSDLAAGSRVTAASVDSSVALLEAALAPAMTAIKDSGEDVGNFMTSSFAADGTGIDKLLDTSKIALTSIPQGEKNVANLELTFNSAIKLDDVNAKEPQGFTFNAATPATTVASVAAAVTVSKEDLPSKELAPLYRNFLKRMKSCYALPAAQRGSKIAGANDTWTFNVTAQECKDIFYNSDPTLYKDGGFGVGYARFSGMSKDGVNIYPALTPIMLQNIKPDTNGVLDGRALVAIRGEDEQGNFLNASIVVKVFTLDGERVLGAIGDQNPTEFYVNSAIDVVNHPLTDGANDYVSSSYSIFLPAQYPNKTVQYAELQTPKGNTIYLGKNGNKSSLSICSDQANKTGCSKPAQIIQGLRFLNQERHDAGEGPFQLRNLRRNFTVSSSLTSTSCPQFLYAGSTVWGVNKCPRTDLEIEDQKAGGLWIATYHFTDNTSSPPLFARHPSRALSNRELVSSTGPDAKAAKLTEATITRFKQYTNAGVASGRAYSSWSSDSVTQSPIWSPASGGYLFDWEVNSGQIPPRQIYMTGSVTYVNVNTSTNAIDPNGAQRGFKSVHSYETEGSTRFYYPADADVRPNWDEKLRFKISKRSQEMLCSPITVNDDISCAGSSGGYWRAIQNGDIDPLDANPTTDYQFTLKDAAGNASAGQYVSRGLMTTSSGDSSNAVAKPITSGTSEDFAAGVWMSYANLWTKDENQRNLTRGYNFYNPY